LIRAALALACAFLLTFVAASVTEGNLLPDGSFETGLAAGWGVWITDGGFRDLLPVIDSTKAFEGKSSLKVNIPSSAGAVMEVDSPPVSISSAGVYTACVALKALGGPVGISVSLQGSKISQSFAVGDDWKRVSVTGTLQPGQTRLVIASAPWSLGKVTAIWLDAAQLQSGPRATAAYEPANPVEMNLTSRAPGHVFFDRSDAVLQLATAGDIPSGATVHVVVSDLYGASRSFGPISPSVQTVSIPPDQTRPYGMFKATATLLDPIGCGLSAPVECVFARLPKPCGINPADSFFGVMMPLQPDFYPLARAIGIHWVRLHDASQLTDWSVVQPKLGPFKYFDESVDAARAAGFQILGMFDGAPAWTTNKPNAQGGYFAYFYNNPDAPDGPRYWREYVDAMASHYRGKIDCWEVWNEPWNRGNVFFPGTPEQYGALLKIAYATAKAANPKATILGIDTYRPIRTYYKDFTKLALQASGSAYYDVFSYHDYPPDSVVGPQDNIEIKDGNEFRALQARYANGPVKPQWTTEGGVGGGVLSMYGSYNDGSTLMADQGKMVRLLVGLMAAGSKRFFLYTFHNDASFYGRTDIVALEYDRAIRPQLAAYGMLARLVDGAGTPSIDNRAPGVNIFRFPVVAGKQVDVLWSYDGQIHELPFPKSADVLDVQGNPLPPAAAFGVGPIPVYVVHSG